MALSYKKLWILMIDNGMNKTELRQVAHISTNAIAKLGKNEKVSIETLMKICDVFKCNIGDIVDYDTSDNSEVN